MTTPNTIIADLAAAFNVSPSFGRASGVILALIGITIWRMRRNYRKSFE